LHRQTHTMTQEDKKDLAQTLYIKGGLMQKEIAKQLDVSEVTLVAWKKAGDWDRFKTSIIASKHTQLVRMYEQLAEINTVISERAQGARYATSKEADTLTKITASIRSLETETSASQIIDVSIGVMEFARKVEPEMVDKIAALFNAYIRGKLK